jgi:hypothetical protein
MRKTLLLAVSLSLITSSAAFAQCLFCQTIDPGADPLKGECMPSSNGVCSGDCCDFPIEGTPCRIPDYVYECSPSAQSKLNVRDVFLDRYRIAVARDVAHAFATTATSVATARRERYRALLPAPKPKSVVVKTCARKLVEQAL